MSRIYNELVRRKVMRRILICSHGKLAEGFRNTLKLFAGDMLHVDVICAYDDDEDPEKKLDHYLNGVNKDDEILAFTDIMGGSVNRILNQYRMMERFPEHFHLIAGVNLPLLLDLALYKPDQYLEKNDISKKIASAADSIVYMNTYIPDMSDLDE